MPTSPPLSSSWRFVLTLSVLLVAGLAGLNASTRDSLNLDYSDWAVQELAPEVRSFQRHFKELSSGPQFVNLVTIEPNPSNVKIRFTAAPLLDSPGLTVSEMGRRSGAIAAINAGFFSANPDEWNTGILKINGIMRPFMKKESEELRFVASGAIGIDADEHWYFIDREGESWDNDLPEIVHALAGGHMLLRDGELHPSITKPEYMSRREERHAGGQHPRTGIARTSAGTILLVTVDGRHPGKARGMTLPEFAAFLQSLGAVDALNLDGGGSTTMWTQKVGVVSRPSGNRQFDNEGERTIRTAVLVVPRD